MKIINSIKLYKIIYCFLAILLLFSSCISENPGFLGRKMQNLTAHYNIYFNAKEQLKESDSKIKLAQVENYNQLLNVYNVPNQKNIEEQIPYLNDVVKRSNIIALEKSASTWVDDAYLLLANAEYLKGNFYNASEYYNYITETYPKETNNKLLALIGHSQTLMAMDMLNEADSVLKIASEIKSKKYQDLLNATIAQSAIYHDNYKEAAIFLKEAIKSRKNKFDKIRWTFILAQLEENNGNADKAYDYYSRVVKSNASFELAFVANLYRIRVQEEKNGNGFDKIATLKKLIKDDKNKEFIDQIYYQIGLAYLQKGNLNLALENFSKSANTNPGSQQQKGISFLKIAELNFDSLKNYTNAQLYYDSTLKALSDDFPNYNSIKKKATNLQYIATRAQIIDKQDELLSLANLSEDDRLKKISEIISIKVKEERKKDSLSNLEIFPSLLNIESKTKQNTTFYFNNLSAVSQGKSEFMKKWGRRSLTDNWRISSLVEMAQNSNKMPDPDGSSQTILLSEMNLDSAKSNYLKEIPLTEGQKKKSNFKIITALFELGNFYKDVLNDDMASIKTFEDLIKRYPDHVYAANTYYQLYRLHSGLNPEKAEEYKKYILTNYSNSDYAKAILDPNFGKTKELKIAAINLLYKDIFDSYIKKDYASVTSKVNQAQSAFSTDTLVKLPLQFNYINALALGYTAKVKPFVNKLNEIVTTYPNDSTVVPRIKMQLDYIKNHQDLFDKRNFALVAMPFEDGYLPEQIRYVSKENIPKLTEEDLITSKSTAVSKVVDKKKKEKTNLKANKSVVAKDSINLNPLTGLKTGDKKNAALVNNSEDNKLLEPSAILKETPIGIKPEPVVEGKISFEKGIREKQAIVLQIYNGSNNIAKSFAGITQYFFTKFDPSTINVIIKDLDKGSKLVIIKGNFYRKEQAIAVNEEFKKKLPEIMTLPTKEYESFIISERNLNLINSQNALNQYKEYLKDDE